jgi:MFS family permease
MTTAALPFIVAATFFMEYLDTTIVATALPQMARSFAVGPNEVSLGMTAYMGSASSRRHACCRGSAAP